MDTLLIGQNRLPFMSNPTNKRRSYKYHSSVNLEKSPFSLLFQNKVSFLNLFEPHRSSVYFSTELTLWVRQDVVSVKGTSYCFVPLSDQKNDFSKVKW